MWIEELENGKYKYNERYRDEFGRIKKVSVTMEKKTAQAQKQATVLLLDKIKEKQTAKSTQSAMFWEIIAQLEKVEQHTLKPATLRQRASCKRYLQTIIPKQTLIEELNQKWVNEILEELFYIKDYSKETMKTYKTYISSAFRYAQKIGYTIDDPTRHLTFHNKTETLEDIENTTPKYLELDELAEVLKLAEKRNHRYRLAIEFLALTGLRQGEMFALQYKNISDSKIQVTGSYDRMAHEKLTPKNRSSYRIVQLNTRAHEVLEEIMQSNIEWGLAKGNPDEYIFLNTRTGKIISDSSFGWFLRTIDFDKKKLSSHIFRHTHISILTELGVPLKAIMDRVGHSQAKTTLQIYTHVTKKINQSLIEKLDTLPLLCP